MHNATERHQRNTAMIHLFARLMIGEMAANAAKGDWIDMTIEELMQEMTHHVAKLFTAMLKVHQIPSHHLATLEHVELRQFVGEYAADVGNIAMFIAARKGNLIADYYCNTKIEPPAMDETRKLINSAEQVLTLVAQMRTRQTTPSTSPKMPEIRATAEALVDDAVAALLPRLRAHLGALVAKQAANEVDVPPLNDWAAFNRAEY